MQPFTLHLVSWRDGEPLLRSVREAVFMREQGVPAELEWDELDESSRHVLALNARGGAIGCGRIVPPAADGSAHIGRMALLPEWRGKGVGSAIMEHLLEYARGQHYALLDLNAQMQAVPFYRRFGFAEVGEVFMDAGIPHIRMRLQLTSDKTQTG
jgi:predicted GNAT family N-acyltransferase